MDKLQDLYGKIKSRNHDNKRQIFLTLIDIQEKERGGCMSRYEFNSELKLIHKAKRGDNKSIFRVICTTLSGTL